MTQTFDPARHGPEDPLFQLDTGPLTGTEIADATAVAVGSSTVGSIVTDGDQDFFAVTFEAGKTYLISGLGSPSGGGTIDETDLHLYDSSGNLIEYDDLDGAGFDASITYTATTTSTYYIMVDGYFETQTGSYTLAIEETVAPPPVGSVGTYEELAEYLKNEGQGPGNEITTSSSTITVNITALTTLGQQMAQWAMEAWEMVADVDFQIVTSGEMVTVDDLNAAPTATNPNGYQAWAYLGAQGNTNGIEMMVSESWFDFGTTLDSYAYQTYVHEFGHILGLNHLGPYNGTADWGIDNYFANDSWQVSVMSYFDQNANPNVTADFGYLAGPMIADILAIQDFYGAPGASGATAGDTVFGLNSNLGNYLDELFTALATDAATSNTVGNAVAFTLYDQGGTDLLDLSFANASTPVDLDLNGGTFSDFGSHDEMIGIAIGTVIENARTGAGNDTILGNAADNRLEGNGGNDSIDGGEGMDTLVGGLGDDTLAGGLGADMLIGGGQNDILTGGAEDDVFVFSALGGEITDYEFDGVNTTNGTFNGDIIALENTTSYSVTTSGGFVTIGGLKVQSTAATGNVAVVTDSGSSISSGSSSAISLGVTLHDTGTAEAFDRIEYQIAANDALSQVHTFNDDGSSERVQHDALSNQAWVKIEDYFNTSGAIYDNRITYDDLSQVRTLTDAEDAFTWGTILEYRDADGALYDKRTNSDSGDQVRVLFDTDSSETWGTVFEYRDADSALYDKRTNYDDGSQLRLIFDTDSSETWGTVLEYRDSDGALYDKRTNYDDGTQVRLIFDTDSSETWSTVLEYRDTDGTLYDKRTNYDDGSQLRLLFDTDSSQSWDTILEYRDADGALYDKRTNYDDGTQVRTAFDADAAAAWDTILEYRDANDALYQKITNYDNGQQQLILFDVDDTETWESYTRLFDTDGILISATYL